MLADVYNAAARLIGFSNHVNIQNWDQLYKLTSYDGRSSYSNLYTRYRHFVWWSKLSSLLWQILAVLVTATVTATVLSPQLHDSCRQVENVCISDLCCLTLLNCMDLSTVCLITIFVTFVNYHRTWRQMIVKPKILLFHISCTMYGILWQSQHSFISNLTPFYFSSIPHLPLLRLYLIKSKRKYWEPTVYIRVNKQ